MTAEEYLREKFPVPNDYTDWQFTADSVIEQLEEFARIKWDEACEAQRKECQKMNNRNWDNPVIDAPKPEYR
jgi:hypothetical protein